MFEAGEVSQASAPHFRELPQPCHYLTSGHRMTNIGVDNIALWTKTLLDYGRLCKVLYYHPKLPPHFTYSRSTQEDTTERHRCSGPHLSIKITSSISSD